MKKIRSLQILVYVVFGLLLIQNLAGSIFEGVADGWNAVGHTANGETTARGRLLTDVILDNKLITNNPSGEVNTGANYTLSDINVSANIRLEKPQENKTPFWFDAVKFVIVMFELGVLIKILRSINDIIKLIVQNEMFSDRCISLIRTTGIFTIAFPVLDYGFEWMSYFEHKMLLNGRLNVINTASFSFEVVLLAIFVFIIAEAFKQGAKLKEQQDLTI